MRDSIRVKLLLLLLPALAVTAFCFFLLLVEMPATAATAAGNEPALTIEEPLTADSSPAARALQLQLSVEGTARSSATVP